MANIFLKVLNNISQIKTFTILIENKMDFPINYLNALNPLVKQSEGVKYDYLIIILCSSCFVDNFISSIVCF